MGNVAMGPWESPATDLFNPANDNTDPFVLNPAGFNWTAVDNGKKSFIDLALPYGFEDYYPAFNIDLRFQHRWMSAVRRANYDNYLDECGETVFAAMKHWRDAFGDTPSLIMRFNEPTSGNGELGKGASGEELVDIIKRVGARLRLEGFGTVRFVVPAEETESFSFDHARQILADSVARPYVGAIAYHPYPYDSTYASGPHILSTSGAGHPDAGMVAIRNQLRDLGEQYGIPVWMTEVSHSEIDPRTFDAMRARAIHIHDEFLYANASAYFGMNAMWDRVTHDQHFEGRENAGLFSEEDTITLIENSTSEVYITGMGRAIGHYARWIRKGAVRLDSGSDSALVQVTAFSDRGRLVLVLINNTSSTQTANVEVKNGQLSGNITGEVSSSDAYWRELTPFALTSPSSLSVSLPAESVVTVAAAFGQPADAPTGVHGSLEPQSAPASTALLANVPNPFNSRTVIAFDLALPVNVDLAIFDVLGRRVRTLAAGYQEAGRHRLFWDGRDETGAQVGSGVYFSRMISGTATRGRPMLLVR